jgi:hypothetical protein
LVYNHISIPYIVVVIDIEPIRERFSVVAPFLDERGRRLVAAAEAFAAGYGGIAAVAMATGIAPSTIGRGLQELAWEEPSERVRRPGAGRKTTVFKASFPAAPLPGALCYRSAQALYRMAATYGTANSERRRHHIGCRWLIGITHRLRPREGT